MFGIQNLADASASLRLDLFEANSEQSRADSGQARPILRITHGRSLDMLVDFGAASGNLSRCGPRLINKGKGHWSCIATA